MRQNAKNLNLSKSDAWEIANAQAVPPQLTDDDLTVDRFAEAKGVTLNVARRILNGLKAKGELVAIRCVNPNGGGSVLAYRKP